MLDSLHASFLEEIEKLCNSVCGEKKQERTEDFCQHCRIYLISEKVNFAFKMNWPSYLQALGKYLLSEKAQIVTQTKREISKRDLR